LNKKVTSNPKYAHVKGQTDTHNNAKGLTAASDQLIAKRRAEKFKRIKCSTLARLLVQNSSAEESIYQLGQGDGMDSVSVVAG